MMKANRLSRSSRLSGRSAFSAVFENRRRRSSGPLTVYARANDLPRSRLGLSVSRRVGSAAQRNRLKRLVREAFRLNRRDLPLGHDWVVVIRGHIPMTLAEYGTRLKELMRES